MTKKKTALFADVTGSDCTIRELVETISEATGLRGTLVLDENKPDGTQRKLLDTIRLNSLRWHAEMKLRRGLQMEYE